MLITSTQQIKEVVPVNGTASFKIFKPYVDAAEDQYIIPLLGLELYTELNNLAADTGTPEQKTLLKKVRYCLVHLMLFKGFDMLNVSFDDAGFERVAKDRGLYRYQEENLKDVFKSEGFNAMDTILEYLQANLTTFEKFKTSDFYLELKGSFFPTTMVFNKIYVIGNSRLVFLQIERFFDQVIDFQIVPVLGCTLFDKVVAEMKKESDPDANLMALVPHIRKPLAYLAVAEGLDEIGLQVTEKGLFFETQVSTMNSHVQTTLATAEQTAVLKEKAELNGKRYKEMLLDYLKTNADTYPDFTQTDLTNTNPLRRDNADKKTVWV